MKPEEKARENIDRQLRQCGWIVQEFAQMDITAGQGVAVAEFPLKTGFADYLLYVDRKAIGIIEAKKVGFTLTGIEGQSAKYVAGWPEDLPAYRMPLPFAYETTGEITQFTNLLDPDARSREVFTFHRPEELKRLVGLEKQLRGYLRQMPTLNTQRLWPAQIEAINNLEHSLAENRPKALIQMTMGSGKTYTACSAVYRLVSFAKAKRVLFLVDRNNLGRQALNEFQQYQSPYSNYKFTEEYNAQRLTRNTIDPASKVCVTTIQRLYSMLKGEPECDEDIEEQSLFEIDSPLMREPMPVVYNPAIPIETFDFIVVDECHRSIYNVWRQVLEYFDAFIIGLTATPTPQTIGFFKGNVVQDYSHEKAVADKVNVDYSVYRIRTQITEGGATIQGKHGFYVPKRDRRTRKKRMAEQTEDVVYIGSQLDRDVVNESQIRTVVKTFKEKLFTEIFPGRSHVPKTLVFAKDDSHAEDIVRIMREEFAKGNDFCQKITYKTTGAKPEEILQQFRNIYNPRIAVTVDMIATGTDVKPLEILLFMRMIQSASYFEQMKGRGVRTINADDLLAVTPDAKGKDCFIIVDAVGVCENDKTDSKPLDRQPSVTLKQVLIAAAMGKVHPDVVSTLAARLARMETKISGDQAEDIKQESDGKTIQQLIGDLLSSLDPDKTDEAAREEFNIPPEAEPTEEQLDQVEAKRMEVALRPFHNPKLREKLLKIQAALEQIFDEVNQDVLLVADFDERAKEKAQSLLANFRQYLEQHQDDIDAIHLLYSRPYRSGLRYKDLKELAEALAQPPLGLWNPTQQLWYCFENLEPDKVQGKTNNSLVDLIALVRHVIYPNEPIIPRAADVEAKYQQWLAEKKAAGFAFTPEQLKWLDAIRDHIASSLTISNDDLDGVPFSKMGGLGKVYQIFGDRLTSIVSELNERLAA